MANPDRFSRVLLPPSSLLGASRGTASPLRLRSVSPARSASPVKPSGSPERRRQILELESPAKRAKTARFAGADGEVGPEERFEAVATAVDRIANTFAATAVSLRDSKLTQETILAEIRAIKESLAKLQEDVDTLKERK